MEESFPKRIFVTGTDTGIGKTFVSALLTLGLDGYYWKPIQSGIFPQTDTAWVQEKTALPDGRFFKEKHLLQAALSPHRAAELEECQINLEDFKLPELTSHSHLIVEGCGGILVPLNGNGQYVIDLIEFLSIPTLIVSRSSLGTINHTLLTLEHLRSRKIPLLGVILNGERNAANRAAIERFGKIKVLGEIEPQKVINRESLMQAYQEVHL